MPTAQEIFVPIDMRLRFLFFGLECIFGIEISGRETNRVFLDSREDQVNSKAYVFFDRDDLTISGTVDAYEPESIWLKVTTKSKHTVDLAVIAEKAEAHLRLIRTFEGNG